jgi:hypothetical protein
VSGDSDGLVPLADDVLGSGRDDRPGALARVPGIWRLLGIAALVGLAVLVGPGLKGPAGDGRPGSARTSPNEAPTRLDAAPSPVVLPVRGDLAGDTGLVAAVLRRVRTEHADATRVLFVGRLPSGTRVAFVGRDRDDGPAVRALDVYALRIPPGGSVQDGAVTVLGRGLIESTGSLAAGPSSAATAPCRWDC